MGGINHYMLPTWDGKGIPTPRYGDVANDLLLKRMLMLKCDSTHLSGMILGGNNVIGSRKLPYHIGQQNINQAKAFLNDKNIKISKIQVGGTTALKVLFDTQTGELKLKQVQQR